MKRIIALTLGLLCVVVMLAGCMKKSTSQITELINVSMSITNVSSTGAKLIIQDNNKEPYTYGEWYKIEKNIGGNWFEVRTLINDYGFNEIGYLPNENGELALDVNWEWLYGKLSSGHYRILKEVIGLYICAEFEITDGDDVGIFDALSPYFEGKVLEKYDTTCLLEVTDIGNGNFTVGDKVIVNTNISGCPTFEVGDCLRISFDGKMALSYPPQVLCVYSIRKVDK